MPISRERFNEGLTTDQFVDLMEANKQKFQDNIEANGELFTEEDKQFFRENPVSIAAIGEDWCTDVIHFLPVVARLEREVPEVELRIFQRDKTEIINDYLNQGEYKSIPVFVFYDRDWNELGHFIERPAQVTEMMAQETRRFAEANPQLEGVDRAYQNMPDETRATVRANSAAFRWGNMLEWNRIFLDEIKEIIRSGVAVAD